MSVAMLQIIQTNLSMQRFFTRVKWALGVSLLVLSAAGFKANAQMRITEFMYNSGSTTGEFVEFTNVGSAAISMSNYSYSDAAATPGSISLSGFGTVQPGESVVFCEAAPATFRAAWNICSGVKIVGSHTTFSLGRADEINLYSGSTLVDKLTYDDQGTGTVKGPRTNAISAYTTEANLGANNASGWILSAVNDIEGSVTSTGGDIGSPGKTKVNAITQTYFPCTSTGTLTLKINNSATTDYIDGGATTAATGLSHSGVISDPTDPGATAGITLDVKNSNVNVAAASYTLTGASSKTSVVPNANILITKSDGAAVVKIVPAGVGYSTITLTLTVGAATQTFVIDYAASAASSTPAQTVFHTGYSDGSAALALDNDYMVIGDDEKNILNVYSRDQSGLPAKSFDFSGIADLALTDMSGGVPREIDVEAVAKSPSATTPNRSYWLGSLSNKSSGAPFNDRPNRNRLFAVDITNTGAATAFSYIGSYKGLRSALINWGNTYSLGLSASAADGKDPKVIDGFNIEGMAFAPDAATMYIGFRAPLEPTTSRVNALLAPIQNFETWFGAGTTATPTIGAPVLLNLNGRGIRDIARLSASLYVILAGDYDDAGAIATAVYRWNGNIADAPVAASGFNVAALNPEGVLPIYNNGIMSGTRLQMISDNGAVAFYGDGTNAKDLGTSAFKKFRSDFITSATPLPIVFEDFQARAGNAGQVIVSWKSAAGAQTDRFVVERSTDGKAFEPATTVFAANGATAYSHTDNVCCAPAFFYRIKQVMTDGGEYYTNIKMVRLQDAGAEGILIGYDNERSLLHIGGSTSAMKAVQVSNLSGTVLLKSAFTDKEQTISLADLPAGVLLVQVKDGNGVKSVKIVR